MLVRRSIPFLIGGRIDAIMAMFRGTFDSWRARRMPGILRGRIADEVIRR